MLKTYLVAAWRNTLKNKGLSVLNIAGLSVGMTAAVLIFFWVNTELHFDNFQKDACRIYRLNTRATDGNWVWEGSAGLSQTVKAVKDAWQQLLPRSKRNSAPKRSAYGKSSARRWRTSASFCPGALSGSSAWPS